MERKEKAKRDAINNDEALPTQGGCYNTKPPSKKRGKEVKQRRHIYISKTYFKRKLNDKRNNSGCNSVIKKKNPNLVPESCIFCSTILIHTI